MPVARASSHRATSLVRSEFPEGPLEDYRVTFRLLRQLLGEVLSPFELLVSDYLALKFSAESPIRPGALSGCLGISPAATTELIDRLESRGFLQRERDPQDRRASRIALTLSGRKMLSEAKTAYSQFLVSVQQEMDPLDLAALERGARGLHEVLSHRTKEGSL